MEFSNSDSEIFKILKLGNHAPKVDELSEPEVAIALPAPEARVIRRDDIPPVVPSISVAPSLPLVAITPIAPSKTNHGSAAMTMDDAPYNLPVVDLGAQPSLADSIVTNILGGGNTTEPTLGDLIFSKLENNTPVTSPVDQPVYKVAKKIKAQSVEPQTFFGRARKVLVYPVIFVVSFAFFYVLLNFSSLVSQVNAWFIKPEDEVVLQGDLVPFNEWMNGYYFAVGNRDLLDPSNDIDKDGLSNHDEFITRTNPTIADSDLDGTSDGLEIINGTNPWGKGAMTEAQKKLLEQLDVIKINNRINFNVVSIVDNESSNVQPKIDYDLNRPGQLSIPKLNMQVPLIWTKDPKDFDVDLTHGVVHYPGTALPGELGTVYVSGHSSDYLWKKHPYKQIFARINALEPGDDIFIDIYGIDGKTYNYRYRVTAENVYKPDDQAQFIDNSVAKLNLSTCWPIGTQKDRYVVSANLVSL